MINAAIVGFGRWGQRLVASVQENGQHRGEAIRFSRAVTRNPDAAIDFLTRQRLSATDNYNEVLCDPAIDAVVLTTPHSLHAEQIVAAAAAEKHVFVEKPLTLSKATAQMAVEVCQKAGVVLAVGHNRRFLPAMQELKHLLDEGALGSILHIEGNFSGSFGLNYTPGMWRASPMESPAGGMTAMGIHIVDTMIHLCGRITGVRALSKRQVISCDIDDTTSALLTFASGSTGYLGTLMATPRVWRIQVFGTKGWAHMRDHEVMDVCGLDNQPYQRTYPFADIERAELEAFAIAASGGPPYPLPLDEAVHGIAVQDAIVGSAKRGGDYVATS